MTTHIGGFFELENACEQPKAVHTSSLALHTGRACLMVMLTKVVPCRVYVPIYTCDAALDPFRELHIDIVYYALDEGFMPVGIPVFDEGDYLLYTNYFGLCEKQIASLRQLYRGRLLIDDTHAFFYGRREGLWSFTSARKYFGVPDGAFLFSPVSFSFETEAFQEYSLTHLKLRLHGFQDRAFKAYQQYENSLDTRVFGISAYSNDVLARVDLTAVSEARRKNFQYLDRVLRVSNRLEFEMGDCVPFCYPYLPKKTKSHQKLYEKNIYPPRLWKDVIIRQPPAWEQNLAKEMLPLPIDHRYGDDEMQKIIQALEF